MSNPAPGTRAVPQGWVPKYLAGSIVVLSLFVGGLIATMHTVGDLTDEIRAAHLPTCGAVRSSSCVAAYPATVLEVHRGSTATRAVLHTSVLADTDPHDECFGTDCTDVVRLRSSDHPAIQTGQQVVIRAGAGRIITVRAGDQTTRTYDEPGIEAFDTASGLVWTLYLDAFAAAWLTAYVFLTLDFRVWRIAAHTFRRALNVTGVVTFVGSVVSFVAFAYHGPRLLLLLATGLLLGSIATALARRHPEVRQPAEFEGRPSWTAPFRRSLELALLVLVAFPLPLMVSVALLFLHDNAGVVRPLIAVAIGAVGAAILIYRTLRSLRKRRPTN